MSFYQHALFHNMLNIYTQTHTHAASRKSTHGAPQHQPSWFCTFFGKQPRTTTNIRGNHKTKPLNKQSTTTNTPYRPFPLDNGKLLFHMVSALSCVVWSFWQGVLLLYKSLTKGHRTTATIPPTILVSLLSRVLLAVQKNSCQACAKLYKSSFWQGYS